MPEGAFIKFFNWFRKNEIETESAEFNSAFAVFYKGEKMERELDIIKVLSPAVQIKLLELKRSQGPFGIGFRGEVMFVVFRPNLFKKMRTNFFKKTELDPRDEEAM